MTDRDDVFSKLKDILTPYAGHLDVVLDDTENYHLNTRHIMKNKKPLFFGAVNINKSYISFHLMPVYVNPSLLDSMSDQLRKRMQGKSCFNFKSKDDALFEELESLTRSGFQFYIDEGYINT